MKLIGIDGAQVDDHELKPYLRLWRHVLILAANDFTGEGYSSQAKWMRESATRWFTSEDKGVGSFQWVCDAVDLNANFLRKRILNHAKTDSPTGDITTG